MKQRGSALLIIVIILAILVVLGFISIQKPVIKNLTAKPTPALQASGSPIIPTPAPTTDPSLIIGWKTYISPAFGFEIKYPKEFSYLDNGPSDSEVPATTSAQLTSNVTRVADKITFTDSNKKSFTLNIYPISPDPNADTNFNNLQKYADICFTPLGEPSKIGDVLYNKAYRTGLKGEALVYYCVFSPKSNLIVLRNNSGSTEIAMKLMLSTLKFAN